MHSILLLVMLLFAGNGLAQDDAKLGPPDWFDNPSAQPDQGEYLFVETELPHDTPLSAERALMIQCKKEIATLIDKWHSESSSDFQLNDNYILKNLVFEDRFVVMQYADEHTKDLASSVGKEFDCFRGYAHLWITDEFHEYVDQRWQKSQTKNRVIQIGLAGGTVICFLAMVFAYLRLNYITRGIYSGRLQTIFLLLAIAVGISAYLLFQLMS